MCPADDDQTNFRLVSDLQHSGEFLFLFHQHLIELFASSFLNL